MKGCRNICFNGVSARPVGANSCLLACSTISPPKVGARLRPRLSNKGAVASSVRDLNGGTNNITANQAVLKATTGIGTGAGVAATDALTMPCNVSVVMDAGS